jgi:hypothetical protein
LEVDRTANFLKRLNNEECEEFAKQHDFALKLFPVFKKKFRSRFQ